MNRKQLRHLTVFLLSSVLLACSKNEEASGANHTTEQTQPKRAELQVGQEAPRFSVTTHSGKKVRLSDYRGKVVVLYFYPMDNTPGCTQEAEGFRDAYESYEQRNAIVLGISTQDNESHQEFAQEYGLPFELLPDEDGAIAKSYGAGSFLGLAKRMTFVIDTQGKLAHIYDDVSPKQHAQEVLIVVDRLLASAQKK